MYILPKDELGEVLYRRIHLLIKKNRGVWATRGAAFGLAGGMLSIFLGALLWAIVPLLARGNFRSFLNLSETLFFVLPLPLLLLGACCLDLLEKRPPILPLKANSRPAGFESPYRLRPQRPHQN
jgi:hypothetical protein